MELMEKIEARVNALASSICEANGASAEVSFRVLFHPVMNEAGATTFAGDVCSGLVGDANVIRRGAPGTGSEDFSFMTEKVPGCYVIIGNGESSSSLHNPNYDFNDDALVYGGSFFARVVEQELAAG